MNALLELSGLAQWVAYSSQKVPISPSGKAASTNDPMSWGTLENAKAVRDMKGLPGVGFVFSTDDPYVGIDLDHAIVDGEVEEWAQKIVDAAASYTEVSPSGEGLHIICTGQIPRAVKQSVNGGGVEVYAERRYFTMTGQHLEGTPQTIEDAQKALDRLAEWADARREPQQTEGPRPTYEAAEPLMWIPQALDYIGSDDYDTWVRVGMALRNECGDAAFSAWCDWSARSEKFDGSQAAWRKWCSFPSAGEGRVSLGTVVWLAEQHGYVIPEELRGRVSVEIPPGFDNDDWDEWVNQQFIEGEQAGLEIQFYDFAEAYVDDTPPEPDIVAPGVLGTGDMMLVAGPPKSMKSWLVLDMLRAWCLGRAWHGMRPGRPLNAAVIQFELKAEKMRERVQEVELTPEEVAGLKGRLVYTDRFTPLLNGELVTQLAEGVEAALDEPPDILVFDPLANIFSGDNENDNAQMMQFVRALKVLRNKLSPDAAIILVHHASKRSSSERHEEPFNAIRGSSALRGAYDTGVYLEKQQEGHVRMWTELRNGPGFPTMDLIFSAGTFVDPGEDLPEKIKDKVLLDAEDGVAWSSSKFNSHHAELWGFSERLVGAVVGEMIISGRLIRWMPEPVHDADAGRSKGFLGVPGMLFRGHPID